MKRARRTCSSRQYSACVTSNACVKLWYGLLWYDSCTVSTNVRSTALVDARTLYSEFSSRNITTTHDDEVVEAARERIELPAAQLLGHRGRPAARRSAPPGRSARVRPWSPTARPATSTECAARRPARTAGSSRCTASPRRRSRRRSIAVRRRPSQDHRLRRCRATRCAADVATAAVATIDGAARRDRGQPHDAENTVSASSIFACWYSRMPCCSCAATRHARMRLRRKHLVHQQHLLLPFDLCVADLTSAAPVLHGLSSLTASMTTPAARGEHRRRLGEALEPRRTLTASLITVTAMSLPLADHAHHDVAAMHADADAYRPQSHRTVRSRSRSRRRTASPSANHATLRHRRSSSIGVTRSSPLLFDIIVVVRCRCTNGELSRRLLLVTRAIIAATIVDRSDPIAITACRSSSSLPIVAASSKVLASADVTLRRRCVVVASTTATAAPPRA
jgi:hypothetical protein